MNILLFFNTLNGNKERDGGWMMDPAPRDPEVNNFIENVGNRTNVYLQDFHKIWTTSGSAELRERKTLYEFADEDKYRQGRSDPQG